MTVYALLIGNLISIDISNKKLTDGCCQYSDICCVETMTKVREREISHSGADTHLRAPPINKSS